MKKILTLLATTITVMVGCSKFDDSALWNSIENLDNRVGQLEELCSRMNTNITSLQAIIQALETHDCITNVVSLPNNEGYIISFMSGKNITIYHGHDGKDGQNGKDGVDGETPIISVKQDSDGIYYWTVNGEWLIVDGNKVKAVGTNGKDGLDGEDGTDGENGADGHDGITPQFKIENGYWFISYDNGNNWTQLGKAVGEDGNNGNDGNDGQDGITPEFKIENGFWYVSYNEGSTWIQIGKATGENGQDGNDGSNGITPQFKIEDGYWFVSYDNGLNWEQAGKATGEDGVDGEDGICIFTSISFKNGYMYLTLNNSEGTVIKLPFASGKDETITINVEKAGTLADYISSEQTRTIISLKITGQISRADMQYINVKMQSLEYLDISEAEYIAKQSYFELNPLRLALPNRLLNTFISPKKMTYSTASGDSPLTPQIININDCINLKKLFISSPEPESPGLEIGEQGQSSLWHNRLDSLVFLEGVTTIKYAIDIANVVVLPKSTKEVMLECVSDYSFASVNEIICMAQVPPQILPTNGSSSIVKEKYETAVLYVPSESIEQYKATEGWKNFKIIKGLE